MKKFASLLFVALPAFAAVSCNPVHFFIERGEAVDTDEVVAHGMMVLGRQLEDPYSVSNITRALASLYPTRAGEIDVSETDLYVRFLPASQEQYDKLESLGVEMLDHPVDFEIIREGDYYHDPSIAAGDITWQYAVVSPDFDFPEEIRYEVLDHCHITEHDVFSRSSYDGIDWDAVERESFRLTGNGAMLSGNVAVKSSAAQPSGRITLIDDRFPDTPEPVKGVRVACNVFVKIGQAYTDEDGRYEIGKNFSVEPRYWLVFKNKKGFGIGLNTILVGGSASAMGKHSSEGYSLEVSSSSDINQYRRCVVNNSAWDYYEHCKTSSGSMPAPPANLRIWIFPFIASSSAVMMQQGAAVDETKIGEYLGDYAFIVKWFLPDVTLGLKDKNDYASIYASTVHELAHATHFQQVGTEYWNKYIDYIITSFVSSGFETYGSGSGSDAGYCCVSEMWAYYLETKFYRMRYRDSGAAFGTSWWFCPQIFYYLDDLGLDYYKIARALVKGIVDRDTLQSKLIALYPEFKTNIMLAFNRYL
jgi:hypothetical protein